MVLLMLTSVQTPPAKGARRVGALHRAGCSLGTQDEEVEEDPIWSSGAGEIASLDPPAI
jgi:hypothetical protein